MATLYYKNTATLWYDLNSWSTTSSSGAIAGVLPTSADAVIFDSGSSTTCTVDTLPQSCLTLTTTGWTGTITLLTALRVYGNIVLSATTTWAGTSTLQSMATSSITTNGSTLQNYTLGSLTAITVTLNDNMYVRNTFRLADSGAGVTFTLNSTVGGNGLFFGGDFVYSNGTTGLAINGTALLATTPSISGSPAISNISDTTYNNVTINNNFSIGKNTVFLGGFRIFGSLTFNGYPDYVDFYTNKCTLWMGNGSSINVDTTGSSLSAQEIMDKYPIYQMGFLQAGTITLNVNVYAKYLYFYHTGTNTTTINGGILYVGEKNGNIGSIAGTPAGGSIVTGTGTIEFTGKGGIGYLQFDSVFNSGAGFRSMNWNINMNIRTQGTLYIICKMNSTANQDFFLLGGGKTFAYYSGTVIPKSLFYLPSLGYSFHIKGGWLSVSTGHTLIGMNKIAWGRIIIGGGGTITMDEFPCGNANIQTAMLSSNTTNYTINLTGSNNERVAQYIQVKNCTLGATSKNKVILTHPKANLGSNSGLRFGDVMGHGIPKASESNQPKFKNGKEIAYGAMGLVSDPNFASI
jgi:hypothetical protein